MTKTELIGKMHKEWDNLDRAQAEGCVNTVIIAISNALAAGEKVQLAGLGIFSVRETKSRTARNPKTGETVQVPAGRKVSFKPAKELKARVQEGK